MERRYAQYSFQYFFFSNWQSIDQFRKEISMLNSRLQSAEARQEDLAMLGQEATKPLLRQIDALQTQYNTAILEWEKLEKRYIYCSLQISVSQH